MYSTDLYDFNRAIKMAQQAHEREMEKKDETIKSLQKKIEAMQIQRERDYSEFKRINEKENRELCTENQSLRQELFLERSENDRLKEENSRLKYDLNVHMDRNVQVENDHAKAKHIISILLNKVQQSQTGPTTIHNHLNHMNDIRQTS